MQNKKQVKRKMQDNTAKENFAIIQKYYVYVLALCACVLYVFRKKEGTAEWIIYIESLVLWGISAACAWFYRKIPKEERKKVKEVEKVYRHPYAEFVAITFIHIFAIFMVTKLKH